MILKSKKHRLHLLEPQLILKMCLCLVIMSIAASEGLTETVSEDTDCDLIERRFARQSQVIFSALKQSSDKNIELAAMLQGNLIMLHGQSGCDSAVLINILREMS